MPTENPSSGTFGAKVVGALDQFVRSTGDRLASRSARLDAMLARGREVYVQAFLRAVAFRNRRRYRAPPDPFQLVWVSPTDIEGVTEFHVSKFRLNGVVRCGDWDRNRPRFEDLDLYQAFRRHFRTGTSWEETAFFDRVVAAIGRGAELWGCRSRADFEARCQWLDELYETIRTDGYRTQAELRPDAGHEHSLADRTRPRGRRLRDEIAVHIGRDGTLLFEDGRNRLSIAKLLGIDTVPVRVLLRHCEWQAIREAYIRGEIDPSSDIADHPDLQSLEGSAR